MFNQNMRPSGFAKKSTTIASAVHGHVREERDGRAARSREKTTPGENSEWPE